MEGDVFHMHMIEEINPRYGIYGPSAINKRIQLI
jgi:hypothetical protein